jgi:sirohydrochlorin ferrochelatase
MKHQHLVVLFVHGSKNPKWGNFAYNIQKNLQSHLHQHQQDKKVEVAFLEGQPPTLEEIVDTFLSEEKDDCRLHVQIIPIFLASGQHVQKDLPSIVQKLRDKYPQQFCPTILPTVGEEASFQQYVAELCLSFLQQDEKCL